LLYSATVVGHCMKACPLVSWACCYTTPCSSSGFLS